MNDRRKVLRNPVRQLAKIIFDNGKEICCSIIEASLTGASLQTVGAPPLPRFFVLKFHASGLLSMQTYLANRYEGWRSFRRGNAPT